MNINHTKETFPVFRSIHKDIVETAIKNGYYMYIHGPRKAAKHLSVKKAAYLWIFWNIVCKFAPFRFSIFILVFFIFYFLKYHLNRRSPALVFRKKKKKVRYITFRPIGSPLYYVNAIVIITWCNIAFGCNFIPSERTSGVSLHGLRLYDLIVSEICMLYSIGWGGAYFIIFIYRKIMIWLSKNKMRTCMKYFCLYDLYSQSLYTPTPEWVFPPTSDSPED